jgi:hypothetical protein
MNMRPVLLILVLSLASCASREPICVSGCFFRSDAQRKELLHKAWTGDADACVQLSNHYDYIELDPKRARYWMQRALELDPTNEVWRHNLAIMKNEKDSE